MPLMLPMPRGPVAQPKRCQTVFGVGHPQVRWMLVGEAPDEDEDRQCEPFLLRQVALLVHPKLILAMGRFAVQALLKSSEPIGKLRGPVHDHAGAPLIVTDHPAYLLRNPVDKAPAWDDLCLACEVLAGVPTKQLD